MIANLLFHPEIDGRTAFGLLQAAEVLTYMQLQLLAVVGSRGFPLPPAGQSRASATWGELSASREFGDLGYAAKELIFAVQPPGSSGLPTNLGVPADQRLTAYGNALFDLMSLERVPPEEQRQVVPLLWTYIGQDLP